MPHPLSPVPPSEQERFYAVALSFVSHATAAQTSLLYEHFASATDIFDHRSHLREAVPSLSADFLAALQSPDDALRRAEEELAFCEQKDIDILTRGDERFPVRLKQCSDAPNLLYRRGKADLNALKSVAVVGTRRCTNYGKDMTHQLVGGIAKHCPQALVVSGLAYGIDICAHRSAMDNGLPTVAVLAHGLDMIYPAHHRGSARQIIEQGGALLTEYPSQTRMDRYFFLSRNRIVAGMTDACIVVESARKGGAMSTCRMAQDYGREVFAFPGRSDDEASEGCNALIRTNRATLITSADDLLDDMQWKDHGVRPEAVERQMFPQLSAEEQRVVDTLQEQNDQSLSTLSTVTGISVAQLSALLFTLEMKGLLRPMAGGTYHLIG